MNHALADYCSALCRRWRWLALGALLALGGTAVALLVARPMFTSQATVFIRTPGDVSKSIDGGDTYARHRAATYVNLAKSPDVAAGVNDILGNDTDPAKLSADISAKNEPNSVLIDISVRESDASQAQRNAAAFLAVLAKRVNELESVDGSIEPRAEFVVVGPPDLPQHRSAWGFPIPGVLLAAVTGGAVLGALAATLRAIFDRSVRDSRDVESITGRRTIEQPTNDADMTLTARAVLRALHPSEDGVLLLTPADPTTDCVALARVLTTALNTLGGPARELILDAGTDTPPVAMAQQLADLRGEVRWVVVACPPILTSVDLDLLVREATAVVLAVALDRTDEDTVRRAGAILPFRVNAIVLVTRELPHTDAGDIRPQPSIEEGADA